MKRKRGFTIVELIFIVAVIAVLAAISVPNFLEAQVRAKMGRSKTELSALSNALSKYYADHGDYPPMHPEVQLFMDSYVYTSAPLQKETYFVDVFVLKDPDDTDLRDMNFGWLNSGTTETQERHEIKVKTPNNAYFSWSEFDDMATTRAGNFVEMPGYDYFASKHQPGWEEWYGTLAPNQVPSKQHIMELTGYALQRLTTPVAYIERLPLDTFGSVKTNSYMYINWKSPTGLPTFTEDGISSGPKNLVTVFSSGPSGFQWKPEEVFLLTYDPTNGTSSNGKLMEIIVKN